ncbi:MAG: enoyl-CoA hydratase-related protein [bacterium]
MDLKTVQFELDAGLALVRMSRPKARNALSREMGLELQEVFGRCAGDGVRAVVLTGEGGAFCAGGDLKEIGGRIEAGERMEEFLGPDYQCAIKALYDLPKPSIAAVNGFAVGGGFDLALACDIRLAAESARFGQVYAQVGLVPDCGGTFLLPRAVGLAKALELILTGEILDARQALEIGLVRSLHPDDQLMEEALALGRRLAEGATLALSAAKSLAKRACTLDIDTALAAEASAQRETSRSADFAEGLAAFREKRAPRFEGR